MEVHIHETQLSVTCLSLECCFHFELILCYVLQRGFTHFHLYEHFSLILFCLFFKSIWFFFYFYFFSNFENNSTYSHILVLVFLLVFVKLQFVNLNQNFWWKQKLNAQIMVIRACQCWCFSSLNNLDESALREGYSCWSPICSTWKSIEKCIKNQCMISWISAELM